MSDFDSDWDTKHHNLLLKSPWKLFWGVNVIGIPRGSHQMGQDCQEVYQKDSQGDWDKILSQYKNQIRLHLNRKLLEGLPMLHQLIVRFDQIEFALWVGKFELDLGRVNIKLLKVSSFQSNPSRSGHRSSELNSLQKATARRAKTDARNAAQGEKLYREFCEKLK